jgi:hypothetical protein
MLETYSSIKIEHRRQIEQFGSSRAASIIENLEIDHQVNTQKRK